MEWGKFYMEHLHPPQFNQPTIFIVFNFDWKTGSISFILNLFATWLEVILDGIWTLGYVKKFQKIIWQVKMGTYVHNRSRLIKNVDFYIY